MQAAVFLHQAHSVDGIVPLIGRPAPFDTRIGNAHPETAQGATQGASRYAAATDAIEQTNLVRPLETHNCYARSPYFS